MTPLRIRQAPFSLYFLNTDFHLSLIQLVLYVTCSPRGPLVVHARNINVRLGITEIKIIK